MSISYEFWAVVLPHTGLLAVVALIGAILAIARRSTDRHDQRNAGDEVGNELQGVGRRSAGRSFDDGLRCLGVGDVRQG